MMCIKLLQRILLIAVAFHFSLHSFAQDKASDIAFGTVTTEDLNLTECAFDKDANAVILMDDAFSNYNNEYNLVTERRIRIKILKEKGIEQGNIHIPFYSHDDFEYITDIEAVVVNSEADGSFSTKTLDRKNIYTKQVNKLYSEVSFALPNVKVGSIIDYKYRSIMKNFGGLQSWEFQNELPTITSSYEVLPIPNSEFAYSVYKQDAYPIKITPNKEAGKVKFEMNNIPGLRDEVYTSSTRNFLQRVKFQLAKYTSRYGAVQTYTTTWEQLAKELLEEKSFGSQANKDLSATPIVQAVLTSTPTEKIKMIYDFVRTNIAWDDISSKYCEVGVKSVLEKKKGNSGDMNLLLISLLKSAGVEAYPLLVSERHHGPVDTTYSYMEQFNKVVACVPMNGARYVLDATDVETPYFMVPGSLLNTTGFIVDKKKYGFVYFNNLPHKQREMIHIESTIKDDGTAEAEATIATSEYARLSKLRRYKTDAEKHQEGLLKPYPYLKVDSFAVDGLKDDSASLGYQLKFHYDLKKTGGYYLLNYNVFTGFDENPFKTQHRFTDIDFGSKYNCIATGSFTLPASMVAETLPANKTLISPDKSLSVRRYMEKTNNEIAYRIVVSIDREKYDAEEYETIKQFYKMMIDLLNEPILLKAK